MSARVVMSERVSFDIAAGISASFGDDVGDVHGATYHWIADPDEHEAWPVLELRDGTVISSSGYDWEGLGRADSRGVRLPDDTLRMLRRAIR